jgi:uncharacterized integral membrane protein
MQTFRFIVGAVVFAALLFLSLQNAETVTLKFFHFASWQAPLVLVVFIAFAAGVASGLLAGALRASRLKRQLGKLRREQRDGAGSPMITSSAPGSGYPRSDRTPVDL